MGLLDVLNGMRNGPRGQAAPSAGCGGMSPITMAILALLAYKGIKHFGGGQAAPGGRAPPENARLRVAAGWHPGGFRVTPPRRLDSPDGRCGGSLGGGAAPGDRLLLRGGLGGLGGLLAGGAAGSILSGGLGGLLQQFQQNGQSEAANSWVSRGPNRDISESDLASSIGTDDIEALARHTGLSRDDLLSGLRQELPGAIDDLTPDGRVPTADEARSGCSAAANGGEGGEGLSENTGAGGGRGGLASRRRRAQTRRRRARPRRATVATRPRPRAIGASLRRRPLAR